ncbi:hypothetical protein IFM89_008237 [Coptis chinensis]|uniref:Uncharacterized protein n=1 Tax=Coptis chinensis TaxID=261450 RepID=A0A835IBP6_9MAGN|nr:hypothetical protein IFM89_008237 [Coptis chinensis]
MSEILCNDFRTVIATTTSYLTVVVYLSSSKISTSFSCVELGICEPSLIKVVAETYRILEKHIKEELKNGEKGSITTTSCSSHLKLFNYKPAPLTYIIRLLMLKLGIDLGEQTVLVALGQAAVYSENRLPSQLRKSSLEQGAEIVKKVYSEFPDFDRIIPALLESGVLKLSESCKFTPGVPIESVLAKPTKGVSEILDKF